MTTPKISFCIISRDNASTIEDTLKSIKDVAAEIIVVDTGSVDKTPEIVKKYTDQLYHFKWADSFSAARNESIKYAKNEWIFIIDTDDILPADSIPKINEAINIALLNNIDGFECQIRNFVEGKVTSIYYMIRLFRKKTSAPFISHIHERLSPEYTTTKCEVVINHRGHDPNLSLPHKEADQRFKLINLDYQENPEDIDNLNNLANYYLNTNNFAKALEIYNQACLLYPENINFILAKVNVLYELNNFAPAFMALEPIFKINKNYLDLRPHLLLGKILFKQKKYSEALDLYNKIFIFTPQDLFRQNVKNFDFRWYFYSLFQACYLASILKDYKQCYFYGKVLIDNKFFSEEAAHLILLTAIEIKDNAKIIEIYETYNQYLAKLPKFTDLKNIYLAVKSRT